ncbi:uncharacterized protein LOC112082071 [Eutrema salsugineum]|uniref:uncharacterized protein LOC112082071 n=1 Tax=Eutrema salsugineum TaxID=72664 RepID=UPI000CED1034|nr:uncharacterized protein LOC112082071 [Eutrema salsugineum]
MEEYHLISDLHPDKTNWTIRVKVLKKWHVKHPSQRHSLQFMLMDEEAETIQAFLYIPDLIKSFDMLIEEGQWICFSEFVVFDETSEEPNSPIGSCIRFLQNTEVDLIDLIEVDTPHGFLKFSDVLGGKTEPGLPIDIMGFVVNIEPLVTVTDDSYPERQDKKTASISFTIKDDKGLLLSCVASGSLALDFNDKIFTEKQLPFDCLLTDWSVKHGEGGYYLRSRGGISRIEFYPKLPQAKTFVRRFWNNQQKPTDVIDLGANDDEASTSSVKNRN